MILGPVLIVKQESSVKTEVRIEFANGETQLLWYEFDNSLAPYITTEVHDGFLVGVLLLAMKNGEDIHIEGAISEKLFYNLTSYYMDIVTIIIPQFRKVKIVPERLVDGSEIGTKGAAVTGFSAGIDSFCAMHDNSKSNVPKSFSITHLLFNNVGSHGEWNQKKAEGIFESRYQLIKEFSQDSGLDIIKINSNLSEVLQMDFQQTHTPRNISAVLMLQKLFGKYYYASAFSYEDIAVKASKSMGQSDPCTVHLLSTELTECIASGSQHSRVEKTKRVAKVPSSRSWLNVCVHPIDGGKNCSSCWKCNRTLMTLEIIGELENYNRVFDLKRWKWSRKWYIPEVILNRNNIDPLTKEIRRLVHAENYTFQIKQKLFGTLVGILPEKVYRSLKRAYQSF